MHFEELVPELRRFASVVVTGPQRSGTTIATRMLAAELGMEAVLEEAFDTQNLVRFVQVLTERPGRVIQAPALSSIVHLLRKNDVAVVFMRRPLDAIQRSEERINWRPGNDGMERAKYFAGDSSEPISEIKARAWERYQKRTLRDAAFELDYDTLASSPLWVPQELRTGFRSRQTAIEPEARPPAD
jgi:hypothetical protein